MSGKAAVATLNRSTHRQVYDLPALLRLAGAGTATYLSYWQLYFALQRAFSVPDGPQHHR